MVCLNSPQLLSKRYMPWRILRAPGAWAPAYMARAKAIRRYKSALVFPEQVLAIKGAGVFEVLGRDDNANRNPNRQTSEVEVTIRRLDSCEILVNDKVAKSVEQIYEYEDQNDETVDLMTIYIGFGNAGRTTNGQPFLSRYLFSAKRDAVAYAATRLKLISD